MKETTLMTSSTTWAMTPTSAERLELLEIKRGVHFSRAVLKELLIDAKEVLFFGKLYELDYAQLSDLMWTVLDSDLAAALSKGDHSTELQDYLVGLVPDRVTAGDVTFDPEVPAGEILPELWRDLEVEVAASIRQVAEKLESAIGLMPSKQGRMVLQQLAKVNARRPTVGDYQAAIAWDRQKENLVILDDSGSMTQSTIARIVGDVVALSYTANAHLALVSSTCRHWAPGSYSVDTLLDAAEYGGTHYETLAPLLDRDWGVVVTVADYDSSLSAKKALAGCTGRIDTVLDISLVNQPTFLAECVGQLAAEVRPLLIANSRSVLSA